MDQVTYFPQTQEWADFWLSVNPKRHFLHRIELGVEGLKLECLVYEYPWHLGQNFLYVPQGPVISNPEKVEFLEVQALLEKFFSRLQELAQKRSSIFAKIDLDNKLQTCLQITDDDSAGQLVGRLQSKPALAKTKILMYNKTYFLDLKEVYDSLRSSEKALANQDFESINTQDLTDFMAQTNDFWLLRSKDIRNSTRRSLQESWRITISKTESDVEDFWSVFSQTQKRQNFPSHSKNYFKQLLSHQNSRLIILRDEQNEPQSAWLGWAGETYLTYLHGGNTDKSFEKFGQYLIHLAAIYRCYRESKPYYDMGGYQVGSGFAKFKDKYKGQLVEFLGPTDILYHKLTYYSIKTLIQLAKLVRS
jgi:lipid II:glycine glycyltransferase (peptidoglycan interpeptide bridge formation enzyme)